MKELSVKKMLDNKELTDKILELERKVAELEAKRLRRMVRQ